MSSQSWGDQSILEKGYRIDSGNKSLKLYVANKQS
jgi:hypothetical protein